MSNEEKISRILRDIQIDPDFRLRFFRELIKTDKPLFWFDILYRENYFSPENNPKPISVKEDYYQIPYWPILGYLENCSQKIATQKNEDIFKKFIDMIDLIVKYELSEKRIDNYHTNNAFSKIIFNLPHKYIKEEYFLFFENALYSKWNNTLLAAEIGSSILPKILESDGVNLISKFFSIIIKPKKIEKQLYNDFVSIIDDYWFNELVEKNRENLIRKNVILTPIIIKEMLTILKENNNAFNIVVINDFENEKNSYLRYEKILINLFRDFLLNQTLVESIYTISQLIECDCEICNRLAVYIIDKKYDGMKSIFWNHFITITKIHFIKHELYDLIKNNSDKFNKEEINKILDWIEEIKIKQSEVHNKDPLEIIKYEAYEKKEWLTAMIKTNNKKVNDLYIKYNEINPAEIEHPGYIIWHGPVQISLMERKPLEEHLIKLENNELIDFFIKVAEIKETFSELESIASNFRVSVSNDPERFSNEIILFLRSPPIIIYNLIFGLKDAFDNNKKMNISNIFTFFEEIVSKEEIWIKETFQDNYNNFVVYSISNFIDSYLSKESQYDTSYYIILKNIVFIIINKSQSEKINKDDVIMSVINSNLGRTYSDLFLLSLREKKINKKDWDVDIKEILEKELSNSERKIELEVILGQYLIQIFYLDQSWAIKNINLFFPKDSDELWKFGFESYLFFANRLYPQIYTLLNNENHYDKALSTIFNNDIVVARISQHAAVAYLNDIDDLKDKHKLLNKIIFNSNTIYLDNVILFLWRNRKIANEKINNKIMDLWEYILDNIKPNLEIDHGNIYAHLLYLMNNYNELNERLLNMINKSIVVIDAHNEHQIVESLLYHADKTPKYVGIIYHNILTKTKYYPFMDESKIKDIIKILFLKGEHENAKAICNLYFKKGFDFLRPIQDEFE